MAGGQAFDDQMRQQVSKPTVRMHTNPTFTTDTHSDAYEGLFVWRDSGRLVGGTRPTNGRNPAAKMAHMVCDRRRSSGRLGEVVVADRGTLRALLRAVKTIDGKTWQMLRFDVSLAASRGVLTVTDLLRQKYWLPAALDADSIDSWAAAFGITGSRLDKMSGLLATIGADSSTSHEQSTLVRKADSAAARAAATAAGTSPESMVHTYSLADEVSSLVAAIRLTDAGLRERNIACGEVVRATGLRTEGLRVTGALSDPCKVKTGQVTVVAPSDNSRFEGTLEATWVEDGRLTARLGPPSKAFFKRERSARRWAGLHSRLGSSVRELIVEPNSFLGAGAPGGLGNAPFVDVSTPVEWVDRTVPLHVTVLAGEQPEGS